MEYFRDITDYNIAEIVNEYSKFLKITCDRECKDIRIIVAYKKILYKVDIIHHQNLFIEFYNDKELDIITSGEEEHMINGLNSFIRSDMFISLNEVLKKCIQSVETEIRLEKNLYPQGCRAVGGKVQYAVIDYSKINK